MNICDLANATITGTNFTWADVQANAINSVARASYLRPDNGGALLPWLYTIIIIVIHLPMVIIRVVRWETVQVWCIVSALFSVVLYVQAYISTQFDPAQVLVWTPLILVIDAGSMAQVFFLVIEARKIHVGGRTYLIEAEGPSEQTSEANGDAPNTTGTRESSSLLAHFRDFRKRSHQRKPQDANLELQRRESSVSTSQSSSAVSNLRWYRDPAIYAAVAAVLLFIAILVLQIIGLVAASKAVNASSAPPPVSWCSPLFQPFGVSVLDGDCHVYDVSQSDTRGIGCIILPGIWQRQWLTGTIVGTSIQLALELADVLILTLVSSSLRWNGVKMKRPWFTIFSGVIVLIITLFYGVTYASSLPPKITERVTVAMNVQGPASYTGSMTSAGLRGTIIGWNDGLFESWKGTYFGTS